MSCMRNVGLHATRSAPDTPTAAESSRRPSRNVVQIAIVPRTGTTMKAADRDRPISIAIAIVSGRPGGYVGTSEPRSDDGRYPSGVTTHSGAGDGNGGTRV